MKNIEVFDGDRAAHYDEAIRKWFPGYDSLMALLFPALQGVLAEKKSCRILILGCGTGNELNLLARLKPDWEFLGVDPSDQMLASAEQKTSNLSNVRLIKGTVEDVTDSFDAIVCMLITHFFEIEAKLEIYQACYSKLKAGGAFILADISGSNQTFNTQLEILEHFLRDVFDEKTLSMGTAHIRDDLYRISAHKQVELLNDAGFGKVTCFFQWLFYHAWLAEK